MEIVLKGLTDMENLFSAAEGALPPDAGTAEPAGAVAVPAGSSGTRTTPTDRASQRRQWGLALAACYCSGASRHTVASAELARSEKVTAETATQTLRFCCEVGLFNGGRGKFTVTEAGWAIAQRWQEDPIHARLLLQEQFLRPHWSVPVARAALLAGCLPAEELGKRLLGDLPGKLRRGRYLVEWLEWALLVHRDQQGVVWPAPALNAQAGPMATALVVPAGAAQESSGQEPDDLMGMTNRKLDELDRLQPQRFRAFIDNLTQLVKSLPA
ncbi:hypothetical protein ACF1HU_33240 [Streptomyces olivaceus]|uniref:hypothetical protein n=1 Tax=Streptomyces TaxID=1883 RepID=UPI0012FE9ACF|nr:hypothetical protein [Streptomyces olivaceus]MBZ6107400.1 hypothetical protein [Streptomyces olivaceus]